jgi:pyrimidine-specific ribonucleoside hydrolase
MHSLKINKLGSCLKSTALIIILVLSGITILHGHSGKARFHLLIDTDAALDDLRAISLFLASPEFEILAITASDGALSPEEGLIKIKALLNSFGHEGIPIGMGSVVQEKAPSWRSFCQKVRWGNEENAKTITEILAVDLILSAIQGEDESVTIVCLGGLTNIAGALEVKPPIIDRISKIVWYNDSAEPLSGTNYEIDREAAQAVVSSGVPLEIISNSRKDAFVFDTQILQSIGAVHSPYGEKIFTTHSDESVRERIESGHLMLWDDLLPVYLLYPGLFEGKISKKAGRLRLLTVRNVDDIKIKFLEILRSRNEAKSLVFKRFPDAPELFAEDVRPYMNRIIQKYGKEEWRAGVLTNELHGHLGIYSIIGAKMGMRARQYFNIGVDDISIISYAGSTPPLSCMNDGLQVSTGGTVGHGLFRVSSEPPYRPEAAFTFKGRTIQIRLKDQYWDSVRADIQKGIELYGSGTEDNWKYVRRLAIKYWLEWDRRKIFILEEIKETISQNPAFSL